MPDIKTGSFSITGLSDLEKRLQELPDKLAKNVVRGAVRAGAVIVQKEARAIAPRDTGEMIRDILVKSPRTRQRGMITYQVYVRTGKRSRLAGKGRNVNRDSFYWRFQEFGTVKMPAHPFMRPAFDLKKVAAADAIHDYMAARIEKELAKRGA